MGTELLERWLRTAAPLVPREGKYWVHADPDLFPLSRRQFWRTLSGLERDWERRRTHVHGKIATIVRPKVGTMGLRIGILLCHQEFAACASDVIRRETATRACASADGTMGSIHNHKKSYSSNKKIHIISVGRESGEISNSENLSGEKKKMPSTEEIVAASNAKRAAKLAEENRKALMEDARTTQQLGMLWRVLYSEGHGFAKNQGRGQLAKLKQWSEEFRLDFEAPIGLMWNDVFKNYPEVRTYVMKQTGWDGKKTPEKPSPDWLHFNREHVTQWWVDRYTEGGAKGSLAGLGKSTL